MRRSVFSYPYIVWMLLFILSPMILIFYYAFTGEGGFTLQYLVSVLDADNLTVLWDSIRLALYTTVICLLLGYPVALMLSRMRKATATLLSVFFIVPMWMNFLLRTYAWKVLLGAYTGILYTEAAVLLGMVYNFLPFMVLPVYTALKKVDGGIIEAAEDLGANPLRVVTRVVVPQSIPGVVSGITMVFMPAVTTFAITRLLSNGMIYLAGDMIEEYFITVNNRPAGSGISLVMLILMLISTLLLRMLNPDKEGGRA